MTHVVKSLKKHIILQGHQSSFIKIDFGVLVVKLVKRWERVSDIRRDGLRLRGAVRPLMLLIAYVMPIPALHIVGPFAYSALLDPICFNLDCKLQEILISCSHHIWFPGTAPCAPCEDSEQPRIRPALPTYLQIRLSRRTLLSVPSSTSQRATPLPETLNEDGMWEDDLDENDKPSCEKPSRTTLAWRCTMWACT